MSEFVIDPETIVPFWLPLFLALSTSQFEVFADTLEFPIEFSDELRAIAKEFSLLLLSYMDVATPEVPPTISINSGAEANDRYLQLWNYTFSQLASKGYADSLYHWAQQCAHKHEQFKDRMDLPTDWDILLIYWAKESTDMEFAHLELSQSTIDALQLIVLRHHIRYQELYIQVAKMERWGTGNDWEDFVIRREAIGSWLINEAFFNLQLSQWKVLFAHLSDEEVQTLNEWGYKHMKSQSSKDRFFSIVDLPKELSDPSRP